MHQNTKNNWFNYNCLSHKMYFNDQRIKGRWSPRLCRNRKDRPGNMQMCIWLAQREEKPRMDSFPESKSNVWKESSWALNFLESFESSSFRLEGSGCWERDRYVLAGRRCTAGRQTLSNRDIDRWDGCKQAKQTEKTRSGETNNKSRDGEAGRHKQTETQGCPNRDRQSRQIETWSWRDRHMGKKNSQKRERSWLEEDSSSLSAEALGVESHYCSMTQMNGALV